MINKKVGKLLPWLRSNKNSHLGFFFILSFFLSIILLHMNVVGASVSEAFYAAHETRDIVLPNQTEHVSQIAVDVSVISLMKHCNLLN